MSATPKLWDVLREARNYIRGTYDDSGHRRWIMERLGKAMTDQTMVERAARAICIDLGEDPDSLDGGLIMLGREGTRQNWEGHECTARAAIQAMREPTEHETHQVSYMTGEWSRRNIEAYIDAALAEKPE